MKTAQHCRERWSLLLVWLGKDDVDVDTLYNH